MKKLLSYIPIFLVLICFTVFTYTMNYKNGSNQPPISGIHSYAYLDSSREMDLKSILLLKRNDFSLIPNNFLDLGFSDANVWILITIPELSNSPLMLELENIELNDVHFFAVDEDTGLVEEKVSGRFVDFSKREVPYQNPVFKVNNYKKLTYLLKIRSPTLLRIPIKIWYESKFFQNTLTVDFLNGWYLSIQLILGAVGAVLLFILGDRYLVFYSIFPILTGFTLLERDSILPFISLKNVYPTNALDFLLIPLLSFISYRYTIHYFNFSRTIPFVKKLQYINFLNLLVYIPFLFLTYKYWYYISTVQILINSLFLLGYSLFSITKKETGSVAQLMAWSTFLLFSIVDLFHLIPLSAQTTIFILTIQSYFFISALVFKIKDTVSEKMEAEKEIKEYKSKELAEKEKMAETEYLEYKKLREINFQKERFISQTSDRLLEPLIGIFNITENILYQNNKNSFEINRSDIQSIYHTSGILLNSVHDLIDYAQLEGESFDFNAARHDLYTIIDYLLNILRPQTLKKQILIRNLIPEDLPPIHIDDFRFQNIIHKIFTIIFSNTKNHGKVDISVNTFREQMDLILEFESTPISIQTIELMFTPFDKLMLNNNQTILDNGMNLCIQTRIMRKMGGDIFLESPKGTLPFFKISIPFWEENTIPLDDPSNSWMELHFLGKESEKIQKEDVSSADYILILDNEINQIEIMENYLGNIHYTIYSCQDIETAEDAISKSRPILMIIDVYISGSSSIDFIKKLRTKYTEIELPIILIISNNRNDNIYSLVDLGINDIINRPFSRDKILSRVKVALNLSKLAKSYERFVPHDFVQLLKKSSITDISLGDQIEREMTVLFSDLRSFTELSESMTPEDNFRFLNSYFARIGPIIRKHNGFIDKYIGDAIMALFPKNTDDALRAAIEIQREITKYNIQHRFPNRTPIKAGIGIHTGDVILGTIGEIQRMEGTVVSDAVNLTSRLENLTKLYGASILISMDTFLDLENQDDYNYRILDKVRVKGKKKFITVIEVFDGLPDDQLAQILDAKIYFEEGVASYSSRDFSTAIELFRKNLSIYPSDKAAKIYIQRAEYYLEHNVPIDWDGVEVLDEK